MNLPNRNPDTGVRYGYISANSLHPELVDELQFGPQAVDVSYKEACTELEDAIYHAVSPFLSSRQVQHLVDEAVEMFEHDCDEPVHEGEYEGVKYRTSWMGGALCVWVFHSSIVKNYRECSPCVPGAGDLDSPDLNGVPTYDVPEEWRWEDES